MKRGTDNKEGKGSVISQNADEKQGYLQGKNQVEIYYNPDKRAREHKYHNPYSYSKHIEPANAGNSYMLNFKTYKTLVCSFMVIMLLVLTLML